MFCSEVFFVEKMPVACISFILLQLIVVTTRVLSFAVTSPVMKFVTGLEVLLQKAQVGTVTSQLKAA